MFNMAVLFFWMKAASLPLRRLALGIQTQSECLRTLKASRSPYTAFFFFEEGFPLLVIVRLTDGDGGGVLVLPDGVLVLEVAARVVRGEGVASLLKA